MMSSKLRKQIGAIATWVLTFILMVIICVPGLWVVLTAFRPNGEVLAKPPVWIPENPSLNNFTKIFARYRFRFKNGLFLGLMLSRTVPGIALSLPIFMIWSRIGLIDAKLGLIIVYVALNVPFTIWLIDGFFRQIPKEMSEAAQVDGCTRWQAFWKIEFPLAKSGIASAGIFAFLTSWNEFALASNLTRSTDSKTLPVGLMDFTAQFTIDWAGMSAMAVIIIIPALVLTFLVQKHLIAGLTFGGVKG